MNMDMYFKRQPSSQLKKSYSKPALVLLISPLDKSYNNLEDVFYIELHI